MRGRADIDELPVRTAWSSTLVMPDGLLNSFESVNLGQETERR